MNFQNRIIGYADADPADLLANPFNHRIHPRFQQDALEGLLGNVGIIQNVIVNQRTGHLIDGHLRVMLAMRNEQPLIPVTYVDLSDEEERLSLASLDAICGLAATDTEQLADLLHDLPPIDGALGDLLESMESDTPPREKQVMTCPHCGEAIGG